MSVDPNRAAAANVESILADAQSTPVSDELRRLRDMLVQVCPSDAQIRFEFDGKLHVHIDVRHLEDVAVIEAKLPSLYGGIFHDVRRGMTARHSFFHRVSAIVDR